MSDKDLPTELREWASWLESQGTFPVALHGTLAREAADEIERLKRLNATYVKDAIESIRALEAEVENLRAFVRAEYEQSPYHSERAVALRKQFPWLCD